MIVVQQLKTTVTGDKNFSELDKYLGGFKPSSLFVLVDENTQKHCYPKLSAFLPPHKVVSIHSGEGNKNVETCNLIWQTLTDANADRNAFLINLGGGVIGDMGGFAAGCYKRGIRFLNIPTTLLAMVDASVGSKTGIDFAGFKNQIGLFNEPVAVMVETDFLKTLPPRELLSGFAEVLKHYLICDKNEFNKLAGDRSPLSNMDWPGVVERNITIKAAIVQKDPTEQNIRRALNFGHTTGHAVESYFLQTGNTPILHGEAVAVGIITESFISQKQGKLSADDLNAISNLILHYFKLPQVPVADFEKILELTMQDKKSLNGSNRFTLLEGIGNYSIDNFVEKEMIIASLNYYNSLLA